METSGRHRQEPRTGRGSRPPSQRALTSRPRARERTARRSRTAGRRGAGQRGSRTALRRRADRTRRRGTSPAQARRAAVDRRRPGAPASRRTHKASRHHSQTLPAMSCRPNGLATNDPTGACMTKPSIDVALRATGLIAQRSGPAAVGDVANHLGQLRAARPRCRGAGAARVVPLHLSRQHEPRGTRDPARFQPGHGLHRMQGRRDRIAPNGSSPQGWPDGPGANAWQRASRRTKCAEPSRDSARLSTTSSDVGNGSTRRTRRSGPEPASAKPPRASATPTRRA